LYRNSQDVRVHFERDPDAVQEPIQQIVGRGAARAGDHAAELAADIVDRGIVMTGGGALIRGLDVLLRRRRLPIHVDEDPLTVSFAARANPRRRGKYWSVLAPEAQVARALRSSNRADLIVLATCALLALVARGLPAICAIRSRLRCAELFSLRS
jgi:hypothetical protein